MNSREAFEAWAAQNGFTEHELNWEVWQAAWEARGKHDAEVCRGIANAGAFDDERAGCLDIADECAQAIEEQG